MMTTSEIETAATTLVNSRYADGIASIDRARDDVRKSEAPESDVVCVLNRAVRIAQKHASSAH